MKLSPYPFLGVVGVELEYPIVDAELAVRPWVEEAFRRLAGRPTSEVGHGPVAFSNELAAHVFEVKTVEPKASLAVAERELVDGVRAFAALLEREMDARLLPTGMHPFMHPSEGALWRRAGRKVYEAYARVFDVSGHGWMNVHSCHVNLPFGSEAETVRLHNAAACLVPYLPALAASSPVVEGRLAEAICQRMVFYRGNQARVPEAAGRVVPEWVDSYADYRRRILDPLYRALARIPEAERLRHEWVNSRGAILRFWRSSLEIRVLDTQECVAADCAIAAVTRVMVALLVRRIERGELGTPDPDVLVRDLERVVRDGTRAAVEAPHLGIPGRQVREVLADLVAAAAAELRPDERRYLDLAHDRLENGNLSERIRRRIEPVPEDEREAAIREVYEELARCLLDNRVWEG